MAEAKRTKYLSFVEVGDTGKTKVWHVVSVNHGNVLAVIAWHGPWRQYVFHPRDTLWNGACLADVQEFMAEQMEARRART